MAGPEDARPAPVLMIRLSSLGDVILATSAARRFKASNPGATLSFLTRAEFAPLLYNHPDIDRVVAWRRSGSRAEGAPALARRLRREKFSGIIDLQGNLTSRLISLALGVPRRVVYDSRPLARRLLVASRGLARRLGIQGRPFRVIDASARAVDRFLGSSDGTPAPDPSVHLASVEIVWAGAEMERLGLAAGAVALAPGARHATKRWPVEYYAETLDRLAARGQAAVPVFLSASAEDLEVERELRRCVRRPESLRLVRQPLRRAAALLSRCRCLVTNDSGMMHLAQAVGTPVVALFGPTVQEFGFFPAGTGHQILERDLACRPCSVHGGASCPRGHFRCLREIAPEEVLLAMDRTSRRTARA